MIRLALHGGAGELAADQTDTREQRAALRRIAEQGRRMLQDGASSVETVERMVIELEDCPLFNAGIGAVLNSRARVELDAAIMSGIDRSAGAVAGVTRARNPIQLARAVMERTPHLFFAGSGADELNRELGLRDVAPETFITELRVEQLRRAREQGVIVLDHDTSFGTVGAVARDAYGHLAAATSTGGLTNKHPGRVGDTPLVGAGTFADDRSVALSCTGTGEAFIRAGFGAEVHARLSYCGWDLQRACSEALADVARYGGRGGCIAIDHEGHLALPFNSSAMFRAWMGVDGNVYVGVGTEESSLST